jgi:hypothetical protein
MLFQNYGLFWHVNRVLWGRPGVKGSLLGYRTEWEGDVDFRRQRGVYVLYDSGYRLLYVGQAGYGQRTLYDRLKQHRSDHLAERWQRFSWFGVDPVQGRAGYKHLVQREASTPRIEATLNHLEAILIAAGEPPMNRQGGKFGKALQFRQSVWPGSDSDVTLEQIAGRLEKVQKHLEKK